MARYAVSENFPSRERDLAFVQASLMDMKHVVVMPHSLLNFSGDDVMRMKGEQHDFTTALQRGHTLNA